MTCVSKWRIRYILRRMSATALRGRSRVATLMLATSRARARLGPGPLRLRRILEPPLVGPAQLLAQLAQAALVLRIIGLGRVGEAQPLHLLGVPDLEQAGED